MANNRPALRDAAPGGVAFIDTLNRWMQTLPIDAAVLLEVLLDDRAGAQARRLCAGALGYLLRKIDLIPDHFEGLGRADDAFVLRLAAAQALEAGLERLPDTTALEVLRLANEATLVQACLGGLYAPLCAFVTTLAEAPFRHRHAAQIVAGGEPREQFLRELRDELNDYQAAPIVGDARRRAVAEIKLFLMAKLGAPSAASLPRTRLAA